MTEHEFDSSMTCNYCGIAEERTQRGEQCLKRVKQPEPQPTAPLSSLEGQPAGWYLCNCPNEHHFRIALYWDGAWLKTHPNKGASVQPKGMHTDFSPLYTPEQVAERVTVVKRDWVETSAKLGKAVIERRQEVDQLREQLAAKSKTIVDMEADYEAARERIRAALRSVDCDNEAVSVGVEKLAELYRPFKPMSLEECEAALDAVGDGPRMSAERIDHAVKYATDDKYRAEYLSQQYAEQTRICIGLRAAAREATQRAEAAEREVAELQQQLDPTICRLQFPNGSVPANVREAAEGWRAVSQVKDAEARSITSQLGKVNREFDDYLKSLAESVGVNMEEFALPSAHGNDRLRWAAMIAQAMPTRKDVDDLKSQLAQSERYDAELSKCEKVLERWPLASGCNGHLCVAGHLANILDALEKAEGKNSQLYVEHGRVLAKYKAERDRIKQQLAQSESAAAAMRLQWCNDAPVNAGWYWWRETSGHQLKMTYVFLDGIQSCPTDGWFDRACNIKEYNPDCQWAGPITEPSEVTDAGRGWLSPTEAERLRGEVAELRKKLQVAEATCKWELVSSPGSPLGVEARHKEPPAPPSQETVREYNARIAVTGESPSTLAELAQRAAEEIDDALQKNREHAIRPARIADIITAIFAPEFERLTSQLALTTSQLEVATNSLDGLRVSLREAAAERDRLRSVLGPALVTIVREYIETAGFAHDADVGRKVLSRIEGAMGKQTTETTKGNQ